ncbi:glycosyltransferase family 4 protein [Candidatus Daviesbacteria bacterium]|nr:glycosyltransferase family 4 protein [Candidatus Daviesbacteria bacterium]
MAKIGLDISVLNDAQKTGIAVYTQGLIKALLRVNQKDRFVLFGISTFATNWYLKNLEFKKYSNVQLRIYKLPARAFRRAFLAWQRLNWPKIERFVGRVDIFHSFNWFFPPQAVGKKVATIFDLTATVYPKWHDPRTSQLDQVRFDKIGREADLVLAISQSSKRDFLKRYPKSRVEVIYPAASEIFNAKVDKNLTDKILRKFNLEPGYILSVSTLEPRKNLIGLIKAYLRADLRQPLVLVGKIGWKSGQALDLVNRHLDKVKQTGFVADEELKILYQNALCLVYPSFYEGFGLPILEAMACGCPVICSNSSSLPEVGGEAVYYVSPGKVEEISKAIVVLAKDKDMRAKLKKLGLKQAKRFSWDRSAKKLNDLYQKLCS